MVARCSFLRTLFIIPETHCVKPLGISSCCGTLHCMGFPLIGIPTSKINKAPLGHKTVSKSHTFQQKFFSVHICALSIHVFSAMSVYFQVQQSDSGRLVEAKYTI